MTGRPRPRRWTHSYMLRMDARPSLLDDDHGATDAATIRRNLYSPVVVVDVDAHELAESACPTEEPKRVDETIREAREADDGSVDMYNE